MKYAELRLYTNTVDADNAVDSILYDFADFSASTLYNDVGTLNFSYPKSLNSALEEGSEIGLVVDGQEVDRYFVETVSEVHVNDGALVRSYQGRSTVAYLEDAIVYPSAYPSPTPAGHSFVDATPGNIMRTLVARAKEREYLLQIDETSFTGAVTSSGAPWEKTITIGYSNGQTLLQVLLDLVARGVADFKMVGRDLHLYNYGYLAQEKLSVVVRRALNMTEGSSNRNAQEFASTVLIEGEGGVIYEVNDAPAIAGYRKRAKYVQQGGIADGPTLTLLAQAELDAAKSIKEEITIGLSVQENTFQPWVDFFPGEWIYIDRYSSLELLQVRQFSLSVDKDRNITFGVALKDLLDSTDEKLRRKIDAITGGNSSNYGPLPNPNGPDFISPEQPVSVSASSNAYRDSTGNPYAQATISWPAVTLNEDGSVADDIAGYDVEYATSEPSYSTGTPNLLIPARYDQQLSTKFDRINKSIGWVSGDNAASVRSTQAKDIWSFGDSFYGVVPSTGSLTGSSFIRNMLVRTNAADWNEWSNYVGLKNRLSTAVATVDSTGWAVDANCTFTYEAGQQRHGTAAGKLTSVTAGNVRIHLSSRVPVVPGTTYTVLAHGKSVTAPRNFDCLINWYDSGGLYLGTNIGATFTQTAVAVPVGTYGRCATVAIAPSSAATLDISFIGYSLGNAEVVYMDGAAVFDGDQRHQTWISPDRTETYQAAVSPEEFGISGTLSNLYCKPNDVTVSGTTMLAFYSQYQASPIQFNSRVDVVSYNTTNMNIIASTNWTTSDIVEWGKALYQESTFLYVFGSHATTKATYLMRVPLSNILGGTKEYWNGVAWTTTRASAAQVFDKEITSVLKVGLTYYGLYIEPNATVIKGATNTAISGSWAVGSSNYTIPETIDGSSRIAYTPRFTNQFTSNQGLSYVYSIAPSSGLPTVNTANTPRALRGPTSYGLLAPPPNTYVPLGRTDDTVTYTSGMSVGMTFSARVRSVDTSNNHSDWTYSNPIVLATDVTPPATPSAPRVTDALRGIRIEWDGLGSAGELMPSDFSHVEIHVSTSSGFTPSFWTLKGTFDSPSRGTFVVMDLAYGTTYYVKLVSVDTDGNSSEPSIAGSATPGQLSDPDLPNKLITGAKVATGTINASNLTVSAFTDSYVPNGSFEESENSPYTNYPLRWNMSFVEGSGINAFVDRTSPLSGSGSLKMPVTVSSSRQYRSETFPVAENDLLYIAAQLKTSIVLSGTKIQLYVVTTSSASFIDQAAGPNATWNLIAQDTGSLTVKKIEGSLTVPAGHKYAAVVLSAKIDTVGAYDIWWDEVEVRKVVGEAAIANASIGNAKIKNAAIDDAKISAVSAGKISAGQINADIVIGGRFTTALTGARVQMDNNGLRAIDAFGNEIVAIRDDGSASFSGSIEGGSLRMPSAPDDTTTPGRTTINSTAFGIRVDGTTNYVKNPSFEKATFNATLGYYVPDGVTPSASGKAGQSKGPLIVDYTGNSDNTSKFGKSSLKVTGTASSVVATLNMVTGLQPSTTYTFSFYCSMGMWDETASPPFEGGYANFQNIQIIENGGSNRVLAQSVDNGKFIEGAYTGLSPSFDPTSSSPQTLGYLEWQIRWSKTFTTPADLLAGGSVLIKLPTFLKVNGAVNVNQALFYDGLQIEPKAYPTMYCDGDQVNCSWDGGISNKHNAFSTRVGYNPIWFSYADGLNIKGTIVASDLVVKNSIKLGSAAPRGSNYVQIQRSIQYIIANNTWSTLLFDTIPGTDRATGDDGQLTSDFFKFYAWSPGIYTVAINATFGIPAGSQLGKRGLRILSQGGSVMAQLVTDLPAGYGGQGYPMTLSTTVFLPGNGYWIKAEAFQDTGNTIAIPAHSASFPQYATFVQVA